MLDRVENAIDCDSIPMGRGPEVQAGTGSQGTDMASQETDMAEDSSPQQNSASPPEQLPAVLGLFDAVMIVVGSIIGSGIFLKIGSVVGELSPYGSGVILSTWMFVGLVTLCGSLALAELAAMFPQAGGPYVYIRESFGMLPAFLWGWTEFWVVRTGSVGALACATVLYFNTLIPLSDPGQTLLAVAIVVGLSAANYRSTRAGASIQSAATVSKVIFILGLIILPFLYRATNTANMQPLFEFPQDASGWGAFAKALGVAMVAVLWPYDGWINLGPVAEDLRDPMKNVPRGMALGLGTVILVYLGANISYHMVLPISQLAESETVAADVFEVMFGPVGAVIAAVGVMISTFGATNSNMITGPRIYLAIARDGLVPAWLQKLHPKNRTPANTIVLQAVWTVLLVVLFSVWDPSGDQSSETVSRSKAIKSAFDMLTDSVICAGLIFYSLAVAAVYVLRRTRPELDRPYRTWGYPVTPALLLIAYLAAFISLLIEQPAQTMLVLELIGAGIIYFYIAAGRKSSTSDSR